MSINLRETLLDALGRLPGTRRFHLHVLVSSIRKNITLFPFAFPRPKAHRQDIVILLSEQDNPDSPRRFVAAVEAHVFIITSTSSAILHISKVDSTGQATRPSPTSALVRSLLLFYADPSTRPVAACHLWIQLFARAQAQYLFPNSAQFPEKKPLNDVNLCKWWKRILSDVATEIKERLLQTSELRLHFLLPGYNELEAKRMMNDETRSATSVFWLYGHPYIQSAVPMPCPTDTSNCIVNLGHIIPSFEDDPKSRFMDELAYHANDEIISPAHKCSHLSPDIDAGQEAKNYVSGNRTPETLRRVSPDEFWERMSFRQECVAGAVTGFFTMIVSSSTFFPGLPQGSFAPGQVSSQMIERVLISLSTGVEFSTTERSIRSTKIVENTIKSLCEGILPSTPAQVSRENPGAGMLDNIPNLPDFPALTSALPGVAPMLEPCSSPNHNPMAKFKNIDAYNSHVYGCISVCNPVPLRGPSQCSASNSEAGKKETVNILTARKKRRRVDITN